MTATSSDAESLREQIELGFDALADQGVDTSDLRARVAYLLDAQPASSDLRAAVHDLIIDAWQSETPNEALAAADALLDTAQPAKRYVDPSDLDESFYRRNPDYQGEPVVDTAQPDLRRTPEAGIDVDELLRILDDAAIQGVVGARLLYAKLAATPAPAEEE